MEPDTAIHAYPFHAIIIRLITPLSQITDRLRTLLNSTLSVFIEISKGGFSSSDAQCPQCEKQLSRQPCAGNTAFYIPFQRRGRG